MEVKGEGHTGQSWLGFAACVTLSVLIFSALYYAVSLLVRKG